MTNTRDHPRGRAVAIDLAAHGSQVPSAGGIHSRSTLALIAVALSKANFNGFVQLADRTVEQQVGPLTKRSQKLSDYAIF
jgi:hypothetical protein